MPHPLLSSWKFGKRNVGTLNFLFQVFFLKPENFDYNPKDNLYVRDSEWGQFCTMGGIWEIYGSVLLVKLLVEGGSTGF